MFDIIEGELVITGDNRNILYPDNYQLKDDHKIHVWTSDIIAKLLNKGEEDAAIVEKRSEVMSITIGQYTLEMAQWCPPFVPIAFPHVS